MKMNNNMNMKRADLIFDELGKAILKGEYGPSGSIFITSRDLVHTYSCSLHCAVDIFQKLREARLIYSTGKRSYITLGPCAHTIRPSGSISDKNSITCSVY